ncbi:hypothetical protein [Palleronia caenipelagi]|uniref:Uncharacterized protein n=1 Tax=Palleronia caenipelagi TaxID=2489174 RepID=A0A547Q535_9RHOB|nr:hypothetical protein [Palleronia caenipelagi]TRD21505.1 hypothetical protein FEV53_08465 [Palleronia caenipelagi]
MRHVILFVLLAVTVAACGRVPIPRIGLFDRMVPETRLPYSARITAPRGARSFDVVVASRGAPLEAVRDTVRFHATRHCLIGFGNSAIRWNAVPGDPARWIAQPDGRGRDVYSGTCVGR